MKSISSTSRVDMYCKLVLEDEAFVIQNMDDLGPGGAYTCLQGFRGIMLLVGARGELNQCTQRADYLASNRIPRV